MNVNDFDYILPEKLIAQTPLSKRSDSRLLIMDRFSGAITHEKFENIIHYLSSDDVLVLNDTKVLPARLFGLKKDTGANIEILLLKELSNNVWEVLAKPAKRMKIGTIISFGDGLLKGECIEKFEDGILHLKMIYDGIFYEILDTLGEMPLPPYIHETLEDKDRYQTVYAKEKGSAAAPTAGLHFTKELLKKIEEKGIQIVYITLHVGLGTFRPVSVDTIENHKMHSEFYTISKESSNILNDAKKSHKRIVAVGTTTVRTLETILNNHNKFIATSGWTDIFIYPGYTYKAVDKLITNFHLPKSTLMMLVSAFSSKEHIMNAYKEAIKEEYRFFSFGDSMFIK